MDERFFIDGCDAVIRRCGNDEVILFAVACMKTAENGCFTITIQGEEAAVGVVILSGYGFDHGVPPYAWADDQA